MAKSQRSSPGIVEERLRLGTGFREADLALVLDGLSGLDRHLASWTPEQVELEILVDERGTIEQTVTINAWISSWAFTAHSREKDLGRALRDVRKELIRQIEERKEMSQPRQRARRDKRRPE